jgi:hypothetical protein
MTTEERDWLFDDERLDRKEVVQMIGSDPRYGELRDCLTAVERAADGARMGQYVACYVAGRFDPRRARKLMKKLFGASLALDTTDRVWLENQHFARALELSRELVHITSGVSLANVLAEAKNVLAEALKPQPVLHQGRDTGFREKDLASALRAIELLGKHVGAWGRDDRDTDGIRTAPQINIILGEQSAPANIIDVTPSTKELK